MMSDTFLINAYYFYIAAMVLLAIVVFIVLHFVDAGYGMMRNSKWGYSINNKRAWFLMEFPIFIAMIGLWFFSPNHGQIVPLIFLILFEVHYFERVFIFPFLIKGKGTMPISVMAMGITFNILNASMQGYWLFYRAFDINSNAYPISWLYSPQFIIGLILFISGFIINLHSDKIIRNLRKNDSDNKHYLPRGGLFNYVTSANYFGELIEWLGFAIFTWSWSGFIFFLWTFANLVPRAAATYKRYYAEFPEELETKKLKRVFPFIY